MRIGRSLVAALVLMSCAPPASPSDLITAARYDDPTKRYPHGVLGDAVEHGTLTLTLANGGERRFVLPENRVFEDTAPRMRDLDGDGAPEVIVVEAHAALGARLVIYGATGEIAATPNIGRSFRWLAPIGAADLDGDGLTEVAYVDRPHLAKRLTIWRFQDGTLKPVATADGFTNHRIGERDIAGGVRDCGSGPEMVVATADWAHVVAARLLSDGSIETTRVSTHEDRGSFARAMACSN